MCQLRDEFPCLCPGTFCGNLTQHVILREQPGTPDEIHFLNPVDEL